MCDKLKIGTQWLESIGDVRNALPGVTIIKSHLYEKLPPDEACLCGVDICATLARIGCECDYDFDGGFWVVH